MKIALIALCAAIMPLVSCVSTQDSAGLSPKTAAGTETISDGAVSVPPDWAKNRVPSFKTKESVFFAGGSTGSYSVGALDQYTLYEWEGGNLVSETRYSASDTILDKNEYRYNETVPFMKITKVIEDGREQTQTQTTYQYEQGRLLKATLKNNSGTTITTYEYSYNGEGNCVSRVMKNGKDIVLAETRYKYAEGRLVSSEILNGKGDSINSTTYQYNAQGNMIKEESRNTGGSISSVLSMTWSNGLDVKDEFAGTNNTPQTVETNEYNANGDLVKKLIENLQGKSVQIVQYEYKMTGQ